MSANGAEKLLDFDLGRINDSLMDDIERARSKSGFEINDPRFKKLVSDYLGDDTYDAYLEWCAEGDEQ